MNWSNSPDGYSIDFNQSTATLYDDEQPEIIAAVAACTNNQIELVFSELVVNTTVEASDFTLSGPGGVFTVASVVAENPNVAYEDLFLLYLSESVQQAGTYTLSIQDVSGNVEDPCGNTAVAASFDLIFNEPISYNTSIAYACNGLDGALEVTTITGGSQPYALIVDGTPISGFTANGLSPGVHQLIVDDQENCGIQTIIEIPNHDIAFLSFPLQDSISCSNPNVEIFGIEVTPPQNSLISWEYFASSGNWEPLDYTSLNPTVIATGTYRVIATDETSGCSASAEVFIDDAEADYIDLSDMLFPNIITPNGDSDNDVWMPYLNSNRSLVLPSVMDTYDLKIFNRWGVLVFDSSRGSGRYWNVDGYADGVYYYEIYYRVECGSIQEGTRAGHFQVIR
jgi:gliding motility-associated-like protein